LCVLQHRRGCPTGHNDRHPAHFSLSTPPLAIGNIALACKHLVILTWSLKRSKDLNHAYDHDPEEGTIIETVTLLK